MISRLHGVVLDRDADSVEVETAGGVAYEVRVPTTVAERLPSPGSEVRLRTVHVLSVDSISLYGFLEADERAMFRRLLATSGVGASLALEMLSTHSVRRLARALVDKDVTALTLVRGVGRKKAQLLVLKLSDRMRDLAEASGDAGAPSPRGAREAVDALVALGYSRAQAERAVRAAAVGGGTGRETEVEDLIRRALERVAR